MKHMNNSTATSDYKYLWDGSTRGWILLRNEVANEPAQWTIFNLDTYAALIIEDERIHADVCRERLAHGAPVLDRLPPRR